MGQEILDGTQWDHSVDVLVVGSGNGALTAALCSKEMGAGDVLVIEKDKVFGGTSATSGGMIWIPNNPPALAEGFSDSFDEAYAYIKGSTPPEHFRPDMVDVFLRNGPRMLDFLHERTRCRYRPVRAYPDYYTDVEGAKTGWRGLEPFPINADELDDDYEKLRPGHAFWHIFGRISVDMPEAHDIPVRAKGWQRRLFKLLLDYVLDVRWRLRSRYARRLTVGRAGIARLFLSLRDRRVPIWLDSPMTELIEEAGAVTGAVLLKDGKPMRVRARKAVILAAGGFEHNQDMREKYLPKPTNRWWSASASTGNTGDAIMEGMRLGAKTALMNKAWWCTTISVPGEKVARLNVQEHCWPGSILVSRHGRRFLNEAQNYMALQEELYRLHTPENPLSPMYQIFDAEFRRKYLVAPLMTSDLRPDWTFPKRWYEGGFLAKSDTIEGLAEKMGIDAANLAATVSRFNGYAATGKDLEFGRGDSEYDRYYSDPTVKPNPCLAPIAKAPFYAMRVDAGDIGTQGGLVINPSGQVMREDGKPIPGLYATSNGVATILPLYPGPGATLGPSMVFGYQAAKHIAKFNEE